MSLNSLTNPGGRKARKRMARIRTLLREREILAEADARAGTEE